MKPGRVSYRFATADDMDQIIQLWVEETEWGVFPFSDSERWMNAPAGVPRTVVACDESAGTIVGQFGFVPTLILAGDRTLRGVRPHSTIVGKRLRDAISSWDPADQPGFAMYKFGLASFAAEGVQVVHMLPNPRWVRLFKVFPGIQVAKFPLWSIPLPLRPTLTLPPGWTADKLTDWGDGVDRLWILSSSQYDCGVVRDSRLLEWKTSLEGSTVLAVRHDGELMGVVSVRMKGDRQWTISDMLTADAAAALNATLIAAVIEGARHAMSAATSAPDDGPVKAAILATPLMEPALSRIGFLREKYLFPFVVQSLDKAVTEKMIAPGGWYLAATD